MPISLGEWRVRIGRFVHWKQVAVDIDKLIATILERRRQLLMREVDDILENTRKNFEKQEAGGESTNTASGSARSSDDQGGSASSVSITAEVLTSTGPASSQPFIREPDQSNTPHLESTSSHDVNQPMSSNEDNTKDSYTPATVQSSSSSSTCWSPGQNHQCSRGETSNPCGTQSFTHHTVLSTYLPSSDIVSYL